jgi:hypothetical protein
VFGNDADGIRAMVRTLAAKAANGKTSIGQICADWAPSSDTIGSIKGNAPNSPQEYARFIGRSVMCEPSFSLELFGAGGTILKLDLLIGLIRAMDRYENGEGSTLKMSDILKGIAMYLEDFVENR